MLTSSSHKKYLIAAIKLFSPKPLIRIPSSFAAMSTYLFRYGLGAAARHLKVTSRCYASQAAEKDLVVIGGGVAGYVSPPSRLARKDSRTRTPLLRFPLTNPGRLHREEVDARRNLSQRRLHTLQVLLLNNSITTTPSRA